MIREAYPPLEPYDSGVLDVGDGNHVYWEQCGRPDGVPAVFLHGGPGAGCTPAQRRLFDPAVDRMVLFDQRGCGRSRPHAGDVSVDLTTNTTANLVADMERLREHLGVDRWLLHGGSWGSTLALAYAQEHPDRVSALLLRGILMLRPMELAWYHAHGASMLFPDAWEEYVAAIGGHGDDVIGAYSKLLNDPDPDVHVPAALAWCAWSSATITLIPNPYFKNKYADPRDAVALARLQTHYFSAGGFMRESQLLDGIDRLRHIPATIIQGRYDVVAPMATAWALHRAWPEAEFHVVPDAGHGHTEPGTLTRVLDTLDRYALELAPAAG